MSRERASKILQEHWDKVIIPSKMQEYAGKLSEATIDAMIKFNRLDELPMPVYEVYEAIEKLLSPGERIIENNHAVADCILLMLNNLYNTDPNGKSES
jgi:hypothetical protein